MRACTKCGETKPLDAFPPVRRGEEKRQSWCRDCFAAAGAAYYRRNRDREKARLLRQVAERRTEIRRLLIEYLRSHPCVDCGETDIVVLEFDHLGEKIADISTYAGGGRTWARVKAEIDRCEVRCANCHRRTTLQRSDRGAQRALARRSTRSAVAPIQLRLDAALGLRRCRVCGETRPLSDFPFRSLKRQTRQWICLSCQRLYTKSWYVRNRRRHIANVGERSRNATVILKGLVRAYLLEHPCVDCGETDPTVLDFDHLRDKRANISYLVGAGLSWTAVQEEIAKCQVRCANCHRRRTAVTAGYYRALASHARMVGRTP